MRSRGVDRMKWNSIPVDSSTEDIGPSVIQGLVSFATNLWRPLSMRYCGYLMLTNSRTLSASVGLVCRHNIADLIGIFSS